MTTQSDPNVQSFYCIIFAHSLYILFLSNDISTSRPDISLLFSLIYLPCFCKQSLHDNKSSFTVYPQRTQNCTAINQSQSDFLVDFSFIISNVCICAVRSGVEFINIFLLKIYKQS